MPMLMPDYVKSIADARFDEHVSLRDAYRTMCEFLVAYHGRGETPTGDLLSFVSLLPDGGSADPAQLQDFIDAFDRVNQSNGRSA
jgi:hypothetical protein